MTKKSKSVKDQESEGVINVGHNEVPEDGIGSRIRSARESKGFSQTAVATRSKLVDPNQRGIARTVLVGYESGQFKPGAREIRILCEVLAVTPNWLIYGEDSGYGVKQASMEAVRKMTLFRHLELHLLFLLKTHERGAFSSLVLSMAGRELEI
jgi:transcriptional regulator with XRE-family HTH domain